MRNPIHNKTVDFGMAGFEDVEHEDVVRTVGKLGEALKMRHLPFWGTTRLIGYRMRLRQMQVSTQTTHCCP
jgi:hypothetical protein